jgi:hypothetical protein
MNLEDKVKIKMSQLPDFELLNFIFIFTFFLLIIMPPLYQYPLANQIPLFLFKYQENQC